MLKRKINSPMYITWKDENNIGIPIIDEQHRGIVSAINSMYYIMQYEKRQGAIKSLLVLLEQYTHFHFITEQNLMKEALYPELEDHLKLHSSLINQTKKLMQEYQRGADSRQILTFLRDWWLHHIQEEDEKYVPYVLEIGKE